MNFMKSPHGSAALLMTAQTLAWHLPPGVETCLPNIRLVLGLRGRNYDRATVTAELSRFAHQRRRCLGSVARRKDADAAR
jgi:hypothetical protein